MKSSLKSAICLSVLLFTVAGTQAADRLRILDEETTFIVGDGDEAVEITRTMTSCAKNKGWLQPLIPVEGVNPVTEIEVLEALNDDNAVVVDMRTQEWFFKATVPGAINIPYTDVALRMEEFNCKKQSSGWDCSAANDVYGFCNGPVCPQSPMAMKAMVRDGFPAEKIFYYRGGMLDWEALGLTTVEGEF